MTTEIEELIKECTVVEYGVDRGFDRTTFDKEKFAQLIVEKCALTLDSMSVPDSAAVCEFGRGYNRALETGAAVIKKRFGVEQ